MPAITESAREIAIKGEFGVVVCGGGPAGVAAAIASARAGAKTMLIEGGGCLGGIWTAGLLAWVIDGTRHAGIMHELVAKLEKLGTVIAYSDCNSFAADPEKVKILLEDLCVEAGVQLRLHTRVCAARVEGRALTHVITESKSGREAFAARMFVDCTGDGDLGAHAGCGFDFGRPDDGLTQPFSLIGLFGGLDPDAVAEFTAHVGPDAYNQFRKEMERAGVHPSYSRASLFHTGGGVYLCMANHQYKRSALNADDITQATLNGRRELHAQVEGLRSLGGVWKNLRLLASADQIGMREGRRLHGRYTLRVDDLTEGRSFPDSVVTATFGVDVHAIDPAQSKDFSGDSHKYKVKPYGIPLRALVSRDRDNLLMAGRCISGDFHAHASYRITGYAVPLGEAAGTTAARSAARGVVETL